MVKKHTNKSHLSAKTSISMIKIIHSIHEKLHLVKILWKLKVIVAKLNENLQNSKKS